LNRRERRKRRAEICERVCSLVRVTSAVAACGRGDGRSPLTLTAVRETAHRETWGITPWGSSRYLSVELSPTRPIADTPIRFPRPPDTGTDTSPERVSSLVRVRGALAACGPGRRPTEKPGGITPRGSSPLPERRAFADTPNRRYADTFPQWRHAVGEPAKQKERRPFEQKAAKKTKGGNLRGF
jgi:hypothetical protein